MKPTTDDTLQAEIAELQRRLEEAEETIRAIHGGAVDAFVVSDGETQRVYTLEGADRPYRLLVEEMQQGAATLQADGTIIYGNRQLAEMLNLSHLRLTGSDLRDFIAPADLATFENILRDCPKEPGKAEVTLLREGGDAIPAQVMCNALPPDCGAAIGVLVTDLTSQRHEEHLKLLIDELNHRVKNTLASVQSIAQQTLRRTDNPAEFAASFDGRIRTLARVHAMLSDMTWRGVDIRVLIQDQVLLGPIDETQLTASGPSVVLDPQLASHLGMVIHELGTNSCKYGALSEPAGVVAVNWTVDDGQLRLEWVERNGPPVDMAPKRGTIFIEQTTAAHGGSAEMLTEPLGITWKIILPLTPSALSAGFPRPAPDPKAPAAIVEGNAGASLKGKRILVVEDEPLVAMNVIDILERAGGEPIGPVAAVAEALRWIEAETIDAALVDANLGGHRVDDVAAELSRRSVPFVFASGYDRSNLPDAFRDAPLLIKPYTDTELLTALRTVLSPG